MFNYNIEIADRCSEILARCRVRANLSRKKLGEEIGVSESTVKAWESGQGSPTLPLIIEWFKVTGENPFRSLLNFFWPEIFQELNASKSDEEIKHALITYISDIAGKSEIKKLHYLILDDIGGEWSGVLDLFCAHAHLSLNSRYRIAEMIQTSYELSVANDHARTPNDFDVDHDYLLNAISSAKTASLSHKFGYIVGAIGNNLLEVSAKVLTESRIDSGVTQQYMAKAMGKSQRTIQNWENGSNPSFLDMCLWFHILDKQLWDYLRNALNPVEELGTDSLSKRYRNELVEYFNSANASEIRKLCYLILGEYGSNWNAVLEMMIEHVCTPLHHRVMMARSIMISYELDRNDELLRGIESMHPDLENLLKCITLGTQEAKNGLNSYSFENRM